MIISGKTLLKIDRLFHWPHRSLELIGNIFVPAKQNNGKIVIIKFMGLGSIVQMDALFDKKGVDRSQVILLTLNGNKELCALTGFEHGIFIRTTNLFYFFQDCFKSCLSITRMRPALVLDYERCSSAVGLFRTFVRIIARCKTVSFENRKNRSTRNQIIYNADEFNQENSILKGIEFLPTGNVKSSLKINYPRSFQRILVNINSSNYLLARRYPLNKFADIITELHKWNSSLEFYLTGSQEEVEYVEQLRNTLTGLPVFTVAGKWDLEKFQDELSHCALFITCDSGPLHIAVQLETPTIAIWGPTQPKHFGYLNRGNLVNVSLNLSCSPCFRHPGSTPARACNQKINCLTNLSPVVIIEKSKEILERSIPVRDAKVSSRVNSYFSIL